MCRVHASAIASATDPVARRLRQLRYMQGQLLHMNRGARSWLLAVLLRFLIKAKQSIIAHTTLFIPPTILLFSSLRGCCSTNRHLDQRQPHLVLIHPANCTVQVDQFTGCPIRASHGCDPATAVCVTSILASLESPDGHRQSKLKSEIIDTT